MATIEAAAAEFLASKRIAVTGISRAQKGHGSNVVYQRLRAGGVDAVVIGTRPEFADETMRECTNLGIKHVWMHRSFGAGSVSATATGYGRERGIAVIDGGCPCMFGPAADAGHKAMRFVFSLKGNVPRNV